MQMLSKRRIGAFACLLAGVMACQFGCSGGGGGGGGGGTPVVDIDEPPQGPVPGLFDAEEAWVIGSPTFILGGFGNSVEYAVLTSDVSGAGVVCLGVQDPPSRLDLEEQSLNVHTAFEGTEGGRNCEVQLTGDVSTCTSDAPFAENPCVVVDAGGSVTVDGEVFAIGEPQIVRFAECSEPPTSLPVDQEWLLINGHPFAINFQQDPASIGAAFAIAGTGDLIESANLFSQLDSEGAPVGCVNELPQGTLDFDGVNLSLDLSFASDTGSASGCSAQFDGVVTYCSTLDPEVVGGGGPAGQLVRFDGTGRFDGNGRRGSLTTLYLAIAETTSTGGNSGPRR